MTRRLTLIVLLFGFCPNAMAEGWLSRFVKEKSSELIQDLAKDYGVDMQWDDVQLGFDALGLTRYKITMGTTGTCIKAKDYGLDVCYEQFTATVLLDVNPTSPKLEEITELTLLKGKLKLRPQLPEQPKEEPFLELPDFGSSILPAGLVATRIGKVRITLEEWLVGSGEASTKGSVNIESRQLGETTRLQGTVSIQNTDTSSTAINFLADSKGGLGSAWTVKTKVQQQTKENKLSVDVTTTLGSKAANRLQGDVKFQQGAMDVTSQLRLVINGRTLAGDFDVNYTDRKVDQKIKAGCQLNTTWGQLVLNKQDLNVGLNCAVTPNVNVPGLDVAKVTLKAEVKSKAINVANPDILTSTSLQGNAVFRQEKLTATVNNQIQLRPKDPLEKWRQKSSVLVQTKLPGDPDSRLIPAPLAELSGPIELKLDETGWQSFSQMKFQAMLATNLRSKVQSLVTQHNYRLQVNKKADKWLVRLDGESVLDDILLYLPDIKAEQPPQPFVDGRVVLQPPEEEEDKATAASEPSAMDIQYNVQVRTGRKPLRLKSNLAKTPIPITIKTNLKDGILAGDVTIAETEIEVFRREGVLRNFQLQFTDQVEIARLDGRIDVPYSAYLVHIDIKGTAARPEVYLTSEPPLAEDKLYAVLVFGRPLDELGDGEMQSVHNVQAAAAEGAMTLASMYYLASTPVESVTYNPESKVFSARIRLASGTSVDVGSDLEEHRRLGLRQRLSSSWSVNTYVEEASDSESPTGTSFLEWARRF